MVGQLLCKFVPQVCKAISKEFQQEYLVCPTDPEDWKKIEERFRNRWNVPHAVSALDGKQLQGLLLPGTFGFSRCRLQDPVGQRGGQWVII